MCLQLPAHRCLACVRVLLLPLRQRGYSISRQKSDSHIVFVPLSEGLRDEGLLHCALGGGALCAAPPVQRRRAPAHARTLQDHLQQLKLAHPALRTDQPWCTGLFRSRRSCLPCPLRESRGGVRHRDLANRSSEARTPFAPLPPGVRMIPGSRGNPAGLVM